jgi:hypothetical protein
MSEKTPGKNPQDPFAGLTESQQKLAAHEAVVEGGCDGYELMYCTYGHEVAWIKAADLSSDHAAIHIAGGTVCMNMCLSGYTAADKYPKGEARHLPVDELIQDECRHPGRRDKIHQWPDWLCDLACQILDNEKLHSPSGKE